MADLGVADPAGFIADTDSGWAAERHVTWAICIPTTGELIAVIGVDASQRLWGRARDGFDDALVEAVGPVTRFVNGALGITITGNDVADTQASTDHH